LYNSRRRYDGSGLCTCISGVDVQPNVVCVADGAQLLQTVERASTSSAQCGNHVTRYQPFGNVFGHGFSQYGSGHPAAIVRLEHPHRHRSQQTGFLYTRIGLIYTDAASIRTHIILKKTKIITINHYTHRIIDRGLWV